MTSRVSTKEKILELLKKETNATVSRLANIIGITEMAVRKHLTILERDSLLSVNEVRQPMGRPLQVYSLSTEADKLFPNSYQNLTVEFLLDLKELFGEEIIEVLLEKRSERQKINYLPKMHNKSFSEKVVELKNIQISKGYMAELNKIDEHTYEFIEYNCPILAVAKEYTHACSCETNMFKKVLGTDEVNRLTCKTEGGDHCRFIMKINQPKKRHAAKI